MSDILTPLLDDLLTTVNNGTPQLDTHPAQHNATAELLDQIAAALGKPLEFYGATGDGETDDTQAFLDAVADGGVIRLRNGSTYVVTQTIANLPSNTWIVGEGDASVIKPTGAAAFTLFDTTSTHGVRLSSFKVDASALPAPHIGDLDVAATAGATTITLKAGHTLQSGDVVYIGNPEFLPSSGDTSSPSTLTYETKTLSNVMSTGATLDSAIVRTSGYSAQTVVVATAGGIGGHVLKATSATGLRVDNCTVYRAVRHVLWLLDCDDVRIEGNHFQDWGYALAAANAESAFAFAVGGFSVSTLRIEGNFFDASRGRRSACAEIRVPLSGTFGVRQLGDAIIANNVIRQITPDTLQYDAGAGFNMVCARRDYGWRRIVFSGNTFDRVGDGFIWCVNEVGPVACTGNVFTDGTKGPAIEITAPNVAITGNVIVGGVPYAGVWVRISPGTGQFTGTDPVTHAALPVGVDFHAATISNNVIRGIYGSNSVGIWVDGGANVQANGPRAFVISGNVIEGTNQDGIQVNLGEGDYIIANNVVLDANAASRERTTLLQDVTFTSGQDATLVVDTTDPGFQYLVANAFVHIYSGSTDTDTNSRQIYSVDRDTGEIVISGNTRPGYEGTFTAGMTVSNPFPGSAGIWLRGDTEHPNGNVLVIGNRVGQGALGTTLRGLRLDDVSGRVVSVFNNFDGCPTETTTVNSPQLLNYNPATTYAAWQTDTSPNARDRLHLRSWQWTWAAQAAGQLASASVAAGSTSAAVAAVGGDWAAGDVLWLGYPGATNSETIQLASDWDGTATLTFSSGTKYIHGASTLASDAAKDGSTFTVQSGHGSRFVAGQVVVFAGDATNTYTVASVASDTVTITGTLAATYASGTLVGGPVRKAARALQTYFWGNTYNTAGSGAGNILKAGWLADRQAWGIQATVQGSGAPKANLDIEARGSSDFVRLGAGGYFGVLIDPNGGHLRPRINQQFDNGVQAAGWRLLNVTGVLEMPVLNGAPTNSYITGLGGTPALTVSDGMTVIAQEPADSGSYYLYTRVGGAWKRLGAYS